MLEIPIFVKGGTEAARGLATQGTREPNFTTDAKRFYVGDQIIGWPKVEAAVAVSTAGNTDLVATRGHAIHLCQVTVGAGAGAFNRKLLLPQQESVIITVLDGSIYELKVIFPASVNPTIEIRNETAGGTLLWSFNPPEAAARTFTLRFVRMAGVWVLWTTNEPLES